MRITTGIYCLYLCNFIDGVLTLNAENTNYAYQVPNFHKCEICLLSFPKESQFQRHMRDHERNDKVCILKRDVRNVSVETGGIVKISMSNTNFSYTLDS